MPPYRGSAGSFSNGQYASGNCRASATYAAEGWTPTTGNVTAVAYASAKACTRGTLGVAYASSLMAVGSEIVIPITPTSGTHTVSVRLNYNFTLVALYPAGVGCPLASNVAGQYTYNACNDSVRATVSWQANLADLTSGGYWSGAYVNVAQNYTGATNDSGCNGAGKCYSYNSSYHCMNTSIVHCYPFGKVASGTNVSTFTASNLNSSHKFWIEVFIYLEADANFSGQARGQTYLAGVNGGTLGNSGWKIASITVK
ncbi:MAG TPA: hypothetical protein VFF67_04410 [Thermoplasmata archaeon]|nr:hypothetical protein [Thermoplasmata archaeon]